MPWKKDLKKLYREFGQTLGDTEELDAIDRNFDAGLPLMHEIVMKCQMCRTVFPQEKKTASLHIGVEADVVNHHMREGARIFCSECAHRCETERFKGKDFHYPTLIELTTWEGYVRQYNHLYEEARAKADNWRYDFDETKAPWAYAFLDHNLIQWYKKLMTAQPSSDPEDPDTKYLNSHVVWVMALRAVYHLKGRGKPHNRHDGVTFRRAFKMWGAILGVSDEDFSEAEKIQQSKRYMPAEMLLCMELYCTTRDPRTKQPRGYRSANWLKLVESGDPLRPNLVDSGVFS
jgi:hypothetical protein